MNSDLISREALKKFAIPCDIHNGALTDLCVPLYQIDNAPTVVVGYLTNCQNCVSDYSRGYDDGYKEGYKAERPQGKWIDLNSIVDKAKCSNCKKIVITEPFGHFNFCPNCGADMRGDSHGQ